MKILDRKDKGKSPSLQESVLCRDGDLPLSLALTADFQEGEVQKPSPKAQSKDCFPSKF
ncbi:hypothetical protein H1Q63_28080 [Desmonostoc muscorum CCALA 125]|nr:hypothetical protein [Desmonostoc muscorum CCALA 125]